MSNHHYNALRDLLLSLHKELLEYQKKAYEAFFGKIPNANAYFGLVMGHESFQWLRTLSELVVVYDELMADKKSVTSDKEKELIPYTTQLLTTPMCDFSKKYLEAIQHEPNIAALHGQIVQELKKFQTI